MAFWPLRCRYKHHRPLGGATRFLRADALWDLRFSRYVPPDQAKSVASVHASVSGSSNSSTSSTPEVRPLKTLLGESAPSLHLNKNTPPNQVPPRGLHVVLVVPVIYREHTHLSSDLSRVTAP